MKFDVGRTYMVSSPNGCSVYNSRYLIYKEIPAGGSRLFVAQESELQLDDSEAVVTEVRDGVSMLLGELMGKLPEWFAPLKAELTALLDGSKFELAWLAGEKKLVLHTDRVSDELLAAVEATAEAAMPATATLAQYNHHIDISWRDINKYAECVTVDDMLAVNPDYQNDLTSDLQWLYPLPKMTRLPSMKDSAARVFVCNTPKAQYTYAAYQGCGFEVVEYNAPLISSFDSVFRRMPNLHTLKGDFTKIVNGLNAMGNNPKLTSFNSTLSNLSNGKGIFNDCRLNKSSALRVMTSIPAYTSGDHQLTIGIHVDHKSDDEVLAAIAEAEAKGWTLGVQWNGTPTAQASVTYGLRKPPIYAKVSELENGERVLDWGHYVTDPTGYEEFRSVEAAREYFGLPEEDLTETE